MLLADLLGYESCCTCSRAYWLPKRTQKMNAGTLYNRFSHCIDEIKMAAIYLAQMM